MAILHYGLSWLMRCFVDKFDDIEFDIFGTQNARVKYSMAKNKILLLFFFYLFYFI